ncbi:MAG: hypothetical protein ACR2O4_12925 [Hyphomicrobiaceae bacterium]
MKLKSAIIVAAIAAAALTACRKEVAHETLKFGAEVPAATVSQ